MGAEGLTGSTLFVMHLSWAHRAGDGLYSGAVEGARGTV